MDALRYFTHTRNKLQMGILSSGHWELCLWATFMCVVCGNCPLYDFAGIAYCKLVLRSTADYHTALQLHCTAGPAQAYPWQSSTSLLALPFSGPIFCACIAECWYCS